MRSSKGHLFNTEKFENLFKGVPPCPYKGLRSFGEEDEVVFFGRESATKKLLDTLKEKSVLALTGGSGSGKSSVVFAGLVPKLHKEDWLVKDFRPKKAPLYQLATVLVESLELDLNEHEKLIETRNYAKGLENNEIKLSEVIENVIAKHNQQRLILIVDQFEELFTLTPSKELRESFLNQLAEATSQYSEKFRVLIIIRLDFLNDVLSHKDLGQGLNNQGTLKLASMNPEELRGIIEKPAHQKGVDLEPGLTKTILNDVLTNINKKNSSTRLPLLEFALTLLSYRLPISP